MKTTADRISSTDQPIVAMLHRDQVQTRERLTASLSVMLKKGRTLLACIEEGGADRYAPKNEQDLDLMIGAMQQVLNVLLAYRSARQRVFLAERIITDMLGGEISIRIGEKGATDDGRQRDAISGGMPTVQQDVRDVPTAHETSVSGTGDTGKDAGRSVPAAVLPTPSRDGTERASTRVGVEDSDSAPSSKVWFPVRFPGKPGLPGATCSIPWSLAEIAHEAYRRFFRSARTIEQMAARGGFYASELDCLLSCDRVHLTHGREQGRKLRYLWLVEARDERGLPMVTNGR
jgi:hypothetical protein